MGPGENRTCRIIVRPRRLVVFSVLQLVVFTTTYIVLLNYYSDAVLKVADTLPQVILQSAAAAGGPARSTAAKRSTALKHRSGRGKAFKGYRDIIFHKPLHISCETCAVVSSSGHLLGSRAGDDIDAHDCVIRMNNAPVVGYGADVGRRTTIRSMANVNLARSFAGRNHSRKEMLIDEGTRSEVILINWMNTRTVRLRKGSDYKFALSLAGRHQHVRFYEFTPTKMMEATRRFQNETGISRDQANTWLSTGWFTMIAALDLCDHVTVYGMVPKDHCEKLSPATMYTPYHYYNIAGPTECQYYNLSEHRLDGGHLFITEKAIFARWAWKYDVTFRFPSWTNHDRVAGVAGGSGDLDTPFLNQFRELRSKYNFTNVADYIQWKRRRDQPQRRMRLQMGGRVFDVDNNRLLDTILAILPGVKPLQRVDTNEHMFRRGRR